MKNQFIFATCQIGYEPIIKKNLLADGLRFSFSRPGFLTFKLPQPQPLFEIAPFANPFIRSSGFCLGKVQAETVEQGARRVWEQVADLSFDQLHVWPRDLARPGHRNYEPGVNDASKAATEALRQTATSDRLTLFDQHAAGNLAQRGDRVLDCVIVDPEEWWVGAHRVDRWVQRWPGGFWSPDKEVAMISRAYLKMSEALAWVAWPVRAGQRCVELGCAPGGASQALLERGLRVFGIDPAEVHPQIMADPNFQHVRKRSGDVRIRDFQEIQWLTADMNIPPSDMLDEVERIVCHRANRIWGLILTLKLNDIAAADQVSAYLERLRSWGYPRVRARQLSHNRQEVCLAGLRPPRKGRRRAFNGRR